MSRNAVTVTLPTRTLGELDRYAAERNLPRSYAAQELLERVLPATSSVRPDPPSVPGHSAAGVP